MHRSDRVANTSYQIRSILIARYVAQFSYSIARNIEGSREEPRGSLLPRYVFDVLIFSDVKKKEATTL